MSQEMGEFDEVVGSAREQFLDGYPGVVELEHPSLQIERVAGLRHRVVEAAVEAQLGAVGKPRRERHHRLPQAWIVLQPATGDARHGHPSEMFPGWKEARHWAERLSRAA